MPEYSLHVLLLYFLHVRFPPVALSLRPQIWPGMPPKEVCCLRCHVATASTKSVQQHVVDYDSGEDTGPLITSDPIPLTEIGKGQADLVRYVIPRPVDIGHQRALEVGTLNGSFTTQ